jgi:hypothetical protein
MGSWSRKDRVNRDGLRVVPGADGEVTLMLAMLEVVDFEEEPLPQLDKRAHITVSNPRQNAARALGPHTNPPTESSRNIVAAS